MKYLLIKNLELLPMGELELSDCSQKNCICDYSMQD